MLVSVLMIYKNSKFPTFFSLHKMFEFYTVNLSLFGKQINSFFCLDFLKKRIEIFCNNAIEISSIASCYGFIILILKKEINSAYVEIILRSFNFFVFIFP